MTLMKLFLAAAAAGLALPAAAESVSSMVRHAIEEGQASGQVDGPIAEQSRSKLNATGALTLTIKRVYLFEQQGCARVQLEFHQADTLLPGTTIPAPYYWTTQLNLCSDGQPPSSLKRRNK